MSKIGKYIKSLSRQEKWMIVFILLLLIAIATRWQFIRDEASEAFKQRFSTETPAEERSGADSANAVPGGELPAAEGGGRLPYLP